MPRIIKDTRITIRLTAALRTAIEREADKSGLSVASEMVQLIGEALAARAKKGGR